MLGMLCIAAGRAHPFARCKTTALRFGGEPVRCVTAPNSARGKRKAARALHGLRVLVPDAGADMAALQEAGICALSGAELPFRLADILCRRAIADFRLDPKRLALAITAGHLGETGEQMLTRLAACARYLALDCAEMARIEALLLDRCGAAVLPLPLNSATYPTQLVLHLSRENFSLLVQADGARYAWENAQIALPERFSAVPDTHICGAALAFLQSGALLKSEITLRAAAYRELTSGKILMCGT